MTERMVRVVCNLCTGTGVHVVRGTPDACGCCENASGTYLRTLADPLVEAQLRYAEAEWDQYRRYPPVAGVSRSGLAVRNETWLTMKRAIENTAPETGTNVEGT